MPETSEFCFRWIVVDPFTPPNFWKLLPENELHFSETTIPLTVKDISIAGSISQKKQINQNPQSKINQNIFAHSYRKKKKKEVFKTAILPNRRWEQFTATENSAEGPNSNSLTRAESREEDN